MTVSILPFIPILFALNFVQGTLTPNGNVSVDCGSAQTFACTVVSEPIEWTTSGMRGIGRGPFMARIVAITNPRITSPDTGGTQYGLSKITISGFNKSDNGGIIRCINAENNNVRGMASISVGLRALTNVVAKEESCDTVTLQWTHPREPNDITTSVSCTPPSPGCAECTTSPCTITGLNPSTEYEFTVTLNSEMCGPSMNTTGIGAREVRAPTNVVALKSCDTVTLQWDQPSEPNDITTSVSCTPPSPGCAECTTSPCTITGLNPSTEYEFTVTLNIGGCRTSMTTTTAKTQDAVSCVASNSTSNDTSPDTPVDSLPSSLAALVLIPVVLLVPFIYPLGVLIAKLCCFRGKSYCEVFWCCGCCKKDKSASYNSTELMKSPHPGEEVEYQNQTRFVTDGEENKDQKGNRQEYVATDATVEQLGDDDGDDITDETIEQQGYEDWIQYAALDFTGDHKGNTIVHHSITDDVTYAAV